MSHTLHLRSWDSVQLLTSWLLSTQDVCKLMEGLTPEEEDAIAIQDDFRMYYFKVSCSREL